MLTVEALQEEIEHLRAQLSAGNANGFDLGDARLAKFVQVAPVILWTIDPDGTITLSEGGALKTLKLEPGQLVGANVFELYADLPAATAPIRAAIAGSEQSVVLDLGDSVWETHYFPIVDDGAVVSVVGLSLDFTARVSAERSQRQTEARWRTLLANTPDVVLVVDSAYQMIDLNRTLTRPRSEVAGSNILSWVGASTREQLRAAIDTVFATGEAQTLMSCDVGQHRWFLNRVFRTTDEGHVDAVTVVASEITEQRKADEERALLDDRLRHLQKVDSLGVLAGGIAHDFNNLLVGIMGNADLALLSGGCNQLGRDVLQEILTASERARDLCRQLLDYSGNGRFELTNVDISSLVNEMEPLLVLSRHGSLLVELELGVGVPLVSGDAAQLRQVVMNLLTNAADAAGDGRVLVRTGSRHFTAEELAVTELRNAPPGGDYVYLEVKDDGPGMSPRVRERIFDPFFTTKEKGRGLGLASVLGILRGHQGALLLETAEGEGTCMQVLVPASDAVKIAEDPVVKSVSLACRTGLVLVADDEPTVRRVATRSLSMLGFEVLEAVDGHDAVAKFDAHKDDIVLAVLDLSMPGLTGQQVLQHIRQSAPRVAAILASGYSENDLADLDADITQFLAKPFRIEQLHQMVADLLGSD